jgi:spore coat polysaccharide biosynthesis protein SpsF (cytidylyltransferase family)
VTSDGVRRLAILQARMSSSRLPGKVLAPVLGQPMLLRQIERLRRCREIDRLVVATSTDPSDDPVAAVCRDAGVRVFRGSLTDVLGRFVEAARPHAPAIVVRLTADCPLTDPSVVDRVIRFFETSDCDYASNCIVRTFPRGLDVEVMRWACLEEAAKEAVLPGHREHVTPFLRAHPERYRLGNLSDPVDRSQLHWTVDEPEDLAFVRLVYERLYPTRPDFATGDILDLIASEPALQAAGRP